jgi:DNA recombination protein RmuC
MNVNDTSPMELVALLVAVAAAVAALLLALRAGRLRTELDQSRRELRTLAEERARLESDREHLRAKLADLGQAAAGEEARRAPLEARLDELVRRTTALTGENQSLLAEREGLRQQLDSQRKWVEETTQHFRESVVAAAAGLMEERSRAASEQNRKDVDSVIAPFKEQLSSFRTRVDQIHSTEAQERGSLKAQIEQLTTMNQAMSAQAQRLVNALTVTSKSTGDWGETILGRILEDSGLRRGHEYELQVNITGVDGERLIPDAVIYLPESRQLIIDSKVSNKAWTEYCAAQDEAAKEKWLDEHLASLRAHIKGLSGRRYTDSPDLRTVDFVLMFVPVEAALLTAFVKDATLYADAYRSRIVLVTPSTLMAVVKLVEGIWNFQKRKESADELAEVGRRLYEKLANFAESVLDVGRSIEQSKRAYDKARGQLSEGRGNALGLAERMTQLGVVPGPGKRIPAELLGPEEDRPNREPPDSA